MKTTREFDPRPLDRSADLALQKKEFDVDTASINRRTEAMNQAAKRRYQAAMAPRAAAPQAQGNWFQRAVRGVRRRLA